MQKLYIISLFITFKLVILANERPNIIFFLIDDQRYDLLSMLDHPFIQTPNIDKLAKNGVYFDEAFGRCGVWTRIWWFCKTCFGPATGTCSHHQKIRDAVG